MRAASEAASLIRRHDYQRRRGRLVGFRKAAQPTPATPLIKDFDAKYDDLLTS